MQIPKLSVITPSLNSGAFLEDAILSVALQDGVPVEHIVQDSLSGDNTLEILRRYPEVRWQWESDSGQSDAINRGFLRASGDLVGWLNADDYYLPGGLKAIAQAAAEHPEADVFHGDCVFVDGDGSIARSKVEHDFDRGHPFLFRLLHSVDGNVLPAARDRARPPAGLRLPGVHGLRVFRAAGQRGIQVSLRSAIHRGVPLARQQHQPATGGTARRLNDREVQRRFGTRERSEMEMEILRQGFRAKRVLRKIVSGNAKREWLIRQQRGENTLWMRDAEARKTCASLACL